jgi:hypothetical protein
MREMETAGAKQRRPRATPKPALFEILIDFTSKSDQKHILLSVIIYYIFIRGMQRGYTARKFQ